MQEFLEAFVRFDWLLEPLTYSFFQRGLIAGILAALAGGALSGFIVWRGMAFIGDALAHVILPGIVIAFVLGGNLLLGALISAIIAVFGIGTISTHRSIQEDTAIGIIFVSFFALGILLMSIFSSISDLSHILFGSILGVDANDLFIMGLLVLFVVLGVVLFFKELLVTSFDKTHAVAIGLSPKLIHYGFLVAIALTTVVTIQTIGVVLVLALLITPAATAGLFTKRLKWVLINGIIISVLSTIIGFYLSYWLDVPPGATIVLVLSFFFLLSLFIQQLRNFYYKNSDFK